MRRQKHSVPRAQNISSNISMAHRFQTNKEKPTGNGHGPRSIAGSPVGLYRQRPGVSRLPDTWGSFLTVSSTQQPRRIGTDSPDLVEAAEVVGHRGRGTEVEWVQRQFVVTVPVLFMVASSFLMSSQRLMWKQRLVRIAVCVYRRGICSGYRAVAGVGSVRFVGELVRVQLRSRLPEGSGPNSSKEFPPQDHAEAGARTL